MFCDFAEFFFFLNSVGLLWVFPPHKIHILDIFSSAYATKARLG